MIYSRLMLLLVVAVLAMRPDAAQAQPRCDNLRTQFEHSLRKQHVNDVSFISKGQSPWPFSANFKNIELWVACSRASALPAELRISAPLAVRDDAALWSTNLLKLMNPRIDLAEMYLDIGTCLELQKPHDQLVAGLKARCGAKDEFGRSVARIIIRE